MVLENEYLFGTMNAPWGVLHSPILSRFFFPFACSLTLPFICCNLNESTEKAYLVLICKELLLGLKQPFNMQVEWKEKWRLGLLAVSSCHSSRCHCLAAIKDSSGGSRCFADKNNRWSFVFALLRGPHHNTRGPREFELLGVAAFSVCVHAYLNRFFVFGFYKLANEFNDEPIDFLRCLHDVLVLKWVLIKFSSTHPQFSTVLLQNKLLATGGRAWMWLRKKKLSLLPTQINMVHFGKLLITFCLQQTKYCRQNKCLFQYKVSRTE